MVLISAVWGGAYIYIDRSKELANKNAYLKAESLSKAYSEQLARTIQQINLLALNGKYDWEHHRHQLDLQDQVKEGLYPPSSDFVLTVINRDGIAVSSTLDNAKIDVSDRKYFYVHKTTKLDLYIDPSREISRRSGRPVIRFSRRLETESGKFDGVVLVAIDPAFIATFNDESSMNPHDFISIQHDDGTLLVSEKGREIRGGEVHLTRPVFPADTGVRRVGGEHYKDGDARILAWQRLYGYPLVSYVGLSEADLYAEHINEAKNYRQISSLVTLIFVLLGGVSWYYSIRNIKRKKKAEEVSIAYRQAVDDSREGFYMLRAIYTDGGLLHDFIIEDCNERGVQLVNRSGESPVGKKLSEVPLLQDFNTSFPSYQKAMQTGFWEDEIKGAQDRAGHPSHLHRRLVKSTSGLAVTIRDISDAKVQEQLLKTLANTDALTGIPNRHWLLNCLPDLLDEKTKDGSRLALMFLDLDNFKVVNDTLGHAIGDRLLQLVAERLNAILRTKDAVARIGGDEFTVLVRDFNGIEEVSAVAQRIVESLLKPFNIQGKPILIGTSIGISMFPDDGLEADALIKKADIAMYSAKGDGKNTYRFYDEELYEKILSKIKAEEELRIAISKDQFVMYYQPRVNTATQEVTGFEALVRWEHPSLGLIMPSEFISIAENSGSIVQLGNLVIKKVCAQLGQWILSGDTVLPVSLNISPRQLQEGGVDQLILNSMQRHRVPADLIEVELTESVMMSEEIDISRQVSAIRAAGIRLHIDDFGTAYSSLSRLQEIDSQVIKIDRSFTSRLGSNKQTDTLVRTIILMAKGLNMDVIAEGVETYVQLEMLQSMGCEEAQGYLFSPPVSATAVRSFIGRRLAAIEVDESLS